MTEVKLGTYRHYKGNLYQVIGVAHHHENAHEEFVVYKSLYDHPQFGRGTLWIRPKEMFLENVVVDGKEIPRFSFIE